MPYVTQDKRPTLDTLVDIMDSMGIKADGDLNYVLFKYCKNHIKPGYNNYKNFLGELNECSQEIRRRLLAKYEDKKIEENGDV
jgi:hypothetical protein